MNIRKILPVIIAAAICGAALYAFSHSHKINNSKKINISPSRPSFGDFSFTEYIDNGAQKKFTIEGKRLESENKRFGVLMLAPFKVMRINEARVTFYENNIPVSSLMARKAILDMPSDRKNSGRDNTIGMLANRIELSGDISLITKEYRTLSCNKLILDNRNERIYASGNCVLRYEGKSVKADLLDSDVKLRNFSFRNDSKKRLKALTRMLI